MNAKDILSTLAGSYMAWLCIALFFLLCCFLRHRLAARLADGLTHAVTGCVKLVVLLLLLYLLYVLGALPLDEIFREVN